MDNSFKFLGKKSLDLLYQDVVDVIYILSKKQNTSITGPVIIHLFDECDKIEDRYITVFDFVSILESFIFTSNKHGMDKQIVLLKHDLQFLATKYVDTDVIIDEKFELMAVDFALFLNDYDEVEK
jgi:hypothetical protein